MNNEEPRSLDELLQEIAEVLFPHLDEPVIDVHSKASDGDTALHVAAWRGNESAVLLLLDAGAKVDEPGDMDCTPLYAAVAQGHVKIARMLLEHGANPDADNELNATPRKRAGESVSEEMRALFYII